MSQLLPASAAALTLVSTAPAAAPGDPGPLTAAWTGPFGGVPPLDRVKVEHFPPAFAVAMTAYREEIRAIAENPDPPSFENTIAALERAGRMLDRVQAVYGIWSSTLSTPQFRTIEQEIEPKLAALRDEVFQNEKLFRRIAAVYESPDKVRLTSEQQRLVWLHFTNFQRAGARLAPAAKARVAAINQRLATLYTTFSQNLLADEEDDVTVITNAADLAGLPDSFRAAAAAEARRRNLPDAWVIANTRSSVEPFLSYAHNRALREVVWRRFISRGDHPGARDNKPIIREILRLRSERAQLLGYPSHAHWRLENQMARTPERALELMEAVWPAALARVREEVADMQQIADTEGAGIRIEPWDYRYYAEKVRKAKYDLDEAALKPYLQLESLREAMFWMAGRLFDLNFTPAPEIPVYHPDVRVWAVQDASGRPVGLFYFDPYARPGKRSGAWMSAYRNQERFEREILPLVSNNSNFLKPNPGEPVLVSWDDARTLFHEFGHALHGLCSAVNYPSLSGTSVPRDFVELPAQLCERWLLTPEVLGRFARHYQTGHPLPPELIERVKRAARFNQGFATTEYLASGLLDLRLHLAVAGDLDPAAFEREELSQLGMPREIVMRHRLPHFAHIFADEGYSAGYYSYLWADTLSADAAEAFDAAGWYDRALAARYREHILSRGNTLDPAEAYRQFRGRDAGIAALMRERGFPVPRGAK